MVPLGPSRTASRSLTYVPPPPPVEPAMPASAVTSVVTVSAVTSIAAASAGGSAAATDLQSLIIVAGLACASEQLRAAVGESSWLVSPLSVGDGSQGKVLGSLIILLSFGVLQGAAASITSLCRSQEFAEGAATVRFPHGYLVVFTLLLQGIWLEALRVFVNGPYDRDVLVYTATAALVVVATVAFGAKFSIKNGDFFGQWNEYLYVFAAASDTLRSFVLPTGFWGPRTYRFRFGFLFSGLTHDKLFCAILPWVKTILISIIAVVYVDHPWFCDIQLGAIGLVLLAFSGGIIFLRPYRFPLATFFTAAVNICTVGALATARFAEYMPAIVPKVVMMAAVGFGGLGTIHGLAFRSLEKFKWKKAERKANEEKSQEAAAAYSKKYGEEDSIGNSVHHAQPSVVEMEEMRDLANPLLASVPSRNRDQSNPLL